MQFAITKKWESGAWKIHHDQTLAQSAQCVQQSLAKHQIPQVRQLLYSSLSKVNFSSSSKLRMP